MNDAIRVFLLDDHEVVRRGLCELLEREGDISVVGEASGVAEALRRVPASRPDVLVVDARLPDGDGVEVCRRIRAVDDSIAVLVLTSYEDEETLFAAIEAGAAGFLLKQVRGTDLVDAVRKIASGSSLLDPRVTGTVLERLRTGSRVPPELEVLTEQERKILRLIGEGMSNREIAERMHLAEKTVKNYVTRILAKLALKRRTQAAVLAAKLFGVK
ncbi:response regulator [Glycomyces tarimensis]